MPGIRLQGALLIVLCVGSAASAQPASRPASKPSGPQRFEEKVAAFEKADRESLPPTGAIVFVGSSSIAGWKLQAAFPQLRTLNRGIVSAHVSDLLYYSDRILLPYHPRTIVFYAGENDLAAGKSAQRVASDVEQLIDKVHSALPDVKFVLIGLKPSPSQSKVAQQRAETNELLRKLVAARHRIVFVDVEPTMLDERGQPRSELFRSDGLHLSAAGYELWTKLIEPHLRDSQK